MKNFGGDFKFLCIIFASLFPPWGINQSGRVNSVPNSFFR